MLRREPSMSVSDVADRFDITTARVYQLSKKRPRSRKKPVFQRIYTSFGRLEISLASVSAYEAGLASINNEHARIYRPMTPLNFRRGVLA